MPSRNTTIKIDELPTMNVTVRVGRVAIWRLRLARLLLWLSERILGSGSSMELIEGKWEETAEGVPWEALHVALTQATLPTDFWATATPYVREQVRIALEFVEGPYWERERAELVQRADGIEVLRGDGQTG